MLCPCRPDDAGCVHALGGEGRDESDDTEQDDQRRTEAQLQTDQRTEHATMATL